MKRIVAIFLTCCICLSDSTLNMTYANEKTPYYEIIDIVQNSDGKYYLRYEAYLNNDTNHRMWLSNWWHYKNSEGKEEFMTSNHLGTVANTVFEEEDGYLLVPDSLAKCPTGNYIIYIYANAGVDGDPSGKFGEVIYTGQAVNLYLETENNKIKSIKRTDYTVEILQKIAEKDCIKLGHIYNTSWMIKKQPTEKIEGLAYRICSRCGHKESISLIRAKKESKVKVIKLKISKKKLVLRRKKSYRIRIKSKASGDSVLKWKSTNKRIARVNRKGKVTAKKKGKCTIKLYMKSGATAKCKVTVK